ncbi:MAG: Cna B-type domain-containing protein, partial [Clostridia bacterium]|nr:Cna B-type domain-containing protein [Clostridia bacterium]
IARAQGEDTFRNTATLIGGGSHSASTNEKHTVQTNDAGVKVNGIQVNLFKIDENQIAKTLGGAKFQLFECELAIGELTDRDVYTQQWWSDLLSRVDRMTAGQGSSEDWEYINSNFKINSYNPVGEPAVTKDNGYTQFTTLSEHKLYAWKEIEAPEGYTTNGEFHYFVAYQHINVNSDDIPQPLLSEEEQLANKQAAWALDDACQFANNIRVASMANLTTWTATNVQSEYTSITATKIWEGDSDNLFETRPKDGIRLQLWRINPDGTREKYGEPVAINADDNGDWPTYVWNRLPSEDSEGKAYKYTVVEEKVDNYTTTYTDNGEGQTSGEIVVVNRMIPKSTEIHVKKVFENVSETAFPAQIQVTLWQVRTDKDGAVQEPEELGDYTIALSAANEWKGKFEKLPTTVAQDGKPYSLTYFVREEDAVAGSFKVSYTFDGKMLPAEGVLETQEDNPIVITNSIPEQDFTVNKVWRSFNGQENEEWPEDKSITVELYRSDVPDEQQLTLTLARPTTALDEEPEPQPIGGDAADDYQSVTYTLTESGTHLYTLHLEHLPKLPDDAYYYLREQSGEGFTPHYGNSSGEKQNDLQEARDGEYLINELNGGYELPEAGGIGTHAFTALGAALLVGAALGYAWLSRIRRKEPGQDRV